MPLEKQASLKIVDHARKEQPPGTYDALLTLNVLRTLTYCKRHSYTFIESSIRNGVLEDPANHRVGPAEGTARTIGSVIQPAKSSRNKFTAADDRILWDWVNSNPQKGGGTDGNDIYKQLEAKVCLATRVKPIRGLTLS